jgi:uncharacterized protein YgiM (DUF1202 family)
MQTANAPRSTVARRRRLAATCIPFAVLVGLLASPETAWSQSSEGTLIQSTTPPTTPKRVRVPTSHANVHMGASSGQQILVLVPQGTELNVLGRDKEWLQVELTPAMRKTGMVMRWYKNEDRGWLHDSTVESVE